MTPSKLFQPITVGELTLQHRVVGVPLTRFRGSSTHVSNPPLRLGMVHIPGIWNQEHIDAWRLITDRVHAKDCYFFQLWTHGRAAYPEVLAAEDPFFPLPWPMNVERIQEYVQLYAEAARNAIKVGFDCVEIHGANSYLLNQFRHSNRRSDQFPLHVIDTVVDAMGAGKTGYCLSPWNFFQDMTMKDPKPTFSYLVSQIKGKSPNFAYIHVVEPRIVRTSDENGFLREILAPKPVISAGGYDQSTAIAVADEKNDLVR
ncbi:FMN-linked oxidoreductase [Armillaria nabsnona]|nr:FMN-linked oxidoreductase [Armillaria nabsnona]